MIFFVSKTSCHWQARFFQKLGKRQYNSRTSRYWLCFQFFSVAFLSKGHLPFPFKKCTAEIPFFNLAHFRADVPFNINAFHYYAVIANIKHGYPILAQCYRIEQRTKLG